MAKIEMGMNWASAWRAAEAAGVMPSRVRRIRTMSFQTFKAGVNSRSYDFALEAVQSFVAGDAWILKGAFTQEFMEALRFGTRGWQLLRPSEFHKMLEGSPDFHRIIDLETGKKYSIHGCKHSAYFYRWNNDPLGIWPEITSVWRVVKIAMGLQADEYERNTPKDGVVDRIQVVRYPPAIGYLEPHVDAPQHQKLFLSGYMSKRGVDYLGGGFYFVDRDDQPLEVEELIDVGDICIGWAGLYHGVAPVDRHKVADWNAQDGRWFLSLYSNASDEVMNRHTAAPVKLSIPGVLP